MPERTPRDPVLVALGAAAVGAAVTGLVMAYFMRRMMQHEDEAARRSWPPWPNDEVEDEGEGTGAKTAELSTPPRQSTHEPYEPSTERANKHRPALAARPALARREGSLYDMHADARRERGPTLRQTPEEAGDDSQDAMRGRERTASTEEMHSHFDVVHRASLLLTAWGRFMVRTGKPPKAPLWERAVKVRWLKGFVASHPQVLGMRTFEVVNKLIRPVTTKRVIRYCELPGVNPGHADVFVSHCWGGKFHDLLSAVFDMCGDDTYVWMDMFAVLQHMKDANGAELRSTTKAQKECDLKFDVVLKRCRAVLLVCCPSTDAENLDVRAVLKHETSVRTARGPNLPKAHACPAAHPTSYLPPQVDALGQLPPQRIWCCYEILHAVINEKPIVLQAGKAAGALDAPRTRPRASSAPAPTVRGPSGDIDPVLLAHAMGGAADDTVATVAPFVPTGRDTVLNMLQLVDISKAQATVESDRANILKMIDAERGVDQTNAIVKGAITGAMAGIMSSGSADGEYSCVPRSVITNNVQPIVDAKFNHAQRDVAFSIAVAGGFGEAMRSLHAMGADPDARTEGGDVCTHWAAQGNQLIALTELRDLGTNLDTANDVGWHAVMWAASNEQGFVASVTQLAKLGMAVNAPGSLDYARLEAATGIHLDPSERRLTSMSPVMWLVPAGFVEGIELLVNGHLINQKTKQPCNKLVGADGAPLTVDVDAANARGLTALMFAAAAGKLQLIDELVTKFKAKVDARMDAHNQTAALWAARHGLRCTVEKLAELGANLNLVDDDGKDVHQLLVEAARPATVDDGWGDPPPGGLGVNRTDVRAATFLWRLESWLCA